MDLTAAASVTRRPAVLALAVAAGAGLILAGAWAIERDGFPPCDLCLLERKPYALAVPVALATALFANRGPNARWAFVVLLMLFACSAALGFYHAGVEWHLWAGPSGCTGPLTAPAAIDDFLKQLQTVKVVRCDAPALRIGGLSLAAWNGVSSMILAAVAARGWWAARTRPVATGAPAVRAAPPSTTPA